MPLSDDAYKHNRLTWLTEIYRTYATDVQRYIYSKVGERFLAEDLTSTVFLKALRWLQEDQSKESVRGWLYATARTTIADYWQMQGQHDVSSLAELEGQFSLYLESEGYAQQQTENRVQHLLNLLPDREREILRLRFLQGYSAAEIAEALGTNANHIRVLQLRALRRAAQLDRQERIVSAMQEQDASFDSAMKLLTPESLRVLQLAHEEAQRLKHHFIGTEHLLWGLTSEGSLSSFLTPLGITPDRIHAGIVFIFDRNPHGNLATPQDESLTNGQSDIRKLLTPRARQVIVLARDEMESQHEQQIRPSHLLLGMMNEGEGIGAGLLRSLSISLVQARTALTAPNINQTCSFCGRSGSQVKRIFPAESGIGGPAPTSFICDKCVEQFHAMLQ